MFQQLHQMHNAVDRFQQVIVGTLVLRELVTVMRVVDSARHIQWRVLRDIQDRVCVGHAAAELQVMSHACVAAAVV